MKKYIYCLTILFLAISCKKMDETYREFVVPDGITYPQKVSNLKFFSGLNRARLTWDKTVDPRVTKAKIYWNNYSDSLIVNIDRNSAVVNCVFDHLDEGMYTFDVITCDAEGNTSIPVEVSGTVYGQNYVSSLSSRSLSNPLINTEPDGTVKPDGEVKWGGVYENLVFSEIRYKDNSNASRSLRVPISESLTICPDVKRNETFEYRSAFVPPTSIDTFYTSWTRYATPFYISYAKNSWLSGASSSLNGWGDGMGSGNNGGYPRATIDGDLASAWHSDPGRPLPHFVIIDMLAPINIHHVDLFLHPSYQYAITVQILVSDAVEQEQWEVAREITFPAGVSTSIEMPENTLKRYLIVKFIDSKVGQYSNLAEINVYGL